jgi:hypothetical protein
MAGGRDYDQSRFENLGIYIAERSQVGVEGDGKVKLNKLLYRADFEAYRLLGASITGEEYKREELGPVAAHLPSLLKRFEKAGVLSIREIPKGPYNRQVPVVERGHAPDPTVFSDKERSIIDRSLSELREHGAKAVSDWSHENSVGWRVKKTGKVIPYSSAPLSIRPLSPRADKALKARFASA